MDTVGGEKGKACAVLSYLLIGIIWYFADKELQADGFARYHVKQGIVFFLTVIILEVAAKLLWFLNWVAGILITILWIFGVVYALSGKERPLPLIGGMAKAMAF